VLILIGGAPTTGTDLICDSVDIGRTSEVPVSGPWALSEAADLVVKSGIADVPSSTTLIVSVNTLERLCPL
jgi:hypothetical protein